MFLPIISTEEKKSRKYLGKKEKTMRGTKGRKDGDSNFIFSYALLF